MTYAITPNCSGWSWRITLISWWSFLKRSLEIDAKNAIGITHFTIDDLFNMIIYWSLANLDLEFFSWCNSSLSPSELFIEFMIDQVVSHHCWCKTNLRGMFLVLMSSRSPIFRVEWNVFSFKFLMRWSRYCCDLEKWLIIPITVADCHPRQKLELRYWEFWISGLRYCVVCWWWMLTMTTLPYFRK